MKKEQPNHLQEELGDKVLKSLEKMSELCDKEYIKRYKNIIEDIFIFGEYKIPKPLPNFEIHSFTQHYLDNLKKESIKTIERMKDDLLEEMCLNYIKNKNTMKEKQIKLTVEQAKSMLGKSTEMDELIKANFTNEELGIKKALPKSYEEVSLTGYFIGANSKIISIKDFCHNPNDIQIYRTKEQAESALAMPKLSQLMDVYNDGWKADWKDDTSVKFVIRRFNDDLKIESMYNLYFFLSFKSQEIANEFFTNFRPLIEKYFML